MIDRKSYVISSRWLRNYINDHCIVRDTVMKGKVPGKLYTWCFYCRRGLFNPEFNKHMTVCFLYKIEEEIGHFNFQLGGMETQQHLCYCNTNLRKTTSRFRHSFFCLSQTT